MNPTCQSFIFTHIPKCGGSSFRSFIYEMALGSNIPKEALYIPGYGGVVGGKDLQTLTEEDRNAIWGRNPLKVLADHCKYQENHPFISKMPQPFYYTLLREPITRFISHYYYFYHKLGQDGYQGVPLEALSPRELEAILVKQRNVQCRYLSGVKKPDKLGWDHALASAKQNLDQTFAAFGILEQIEKSIELLNQQLPGWLTPKNDFPMLKKNPMRQPVPPAVLKQIRQHHTIDLALYDFAVELFEKKYNTHKGIYP